MIYIFLFINLLISNEEQFYSEEGGVVFEETVNKNDLKSNPFSEGRDPFYRPLDTFVLGETGYELEKYSLEEFILKGVVWSIKNPIALFQGPKGAKYRLRIGDKIGRNNGVITKIENAQVEILEIILGEQIPTIIKINRG